MNIEEIAAEMEEKTFKSGNGGGGGTKSVKKKKVSPKRIKLVMAEARKNSQKRRAAQPIEEIERVFKAFPHFKSAVEGKKFFFEYMDWLELSISKKQAHINEKDFYWNAFRAGGPGGQNVNKVSSAVAYMHLPTNIIAKSAETRDQLKNREITMNRVVQRVEDHFDSWQRVLNGSNKGLSYKFIQNYLKNLFTSKNIDEKNAVLIRFAQILKIKQ